MARITLQDISIGDAISSAETNTTLQSWRDQSINVDNENVRSEGLHRRNFAANAVVTPPNSNQYVSAPLGSMSINSATPVLVDIAGTPQVIGPFSFDLTDTNAELLVFGSLQYRNGSHPVGVTSTSAGVWNMRLCYSTTASTGPWTGIDETLRKTGFGFVPPNTIYRHGSISWAHRFGPIATTSSLYFGIQVWEPRAARLIKIEYTTLHAIYVQR